MHIFWHIMHNVLHIYWHILHIGMITYCAYSAYLLTYSLVICILCILCIQFYFGHILHILHILSTSLIAVSFVVYSVLLGPPSKGPAVHVPPPTSIATVLTFVTRSSRKVWWFSSHVIGYCPFLTHWNNRKRSQYGADWNDIQHLCLFPALVDDWGLICVHPGWGEKQNPSEYV